MAIGNWRLAIGDWGFGLVAGVVVGMNHRVKDNNRVVTRELTGSFNYGYCSQRLLGLTTGRDKFSRGFFRRGSRRGKFFGSLFRARLPFLDSGGFCRGSFSRRNLCGFRDSTVEGTTSRNGYIFINEATSCILHSCGGMVGVFVATGVSSHVGTIYGQGSVSETDTHGFVRDRRRRQTSCCSCCANGG